jgi:hypothetical protein
VFTDASNKVASLLPLGETIPDVVDTLDKVHPVSMLTDPDSVFVAAGSTNKAGHPTVPPLEK